jgi:hypothetical protein
MTLTNILQPSDYVSGLVCTVGYTVCESAFKKIIGDTATCFSLDAVIFDTTCSNNPGSPLLQTNDMRTDMKFLLLCYISLSAPQIKSGSSKPVLPVPQD